MSESASILRVIERLRERGCEPRELRHRDVWRARCPAHRDREPSLELGVARDGWVWVRCYAGCRTDDILAALDLPRAALAPDADDGRRQASGRHDGSSTHAVSVYPTIDAAIAGYRHGRPDAVWTYRDARGDPLIVVARWNTSRGKTIRPVYRVDGGWVHGAPPPPRPLYRLPELLASAVDEPVVVVEGEKCADAVAEIGFVATTSWGGAAAAHNADWSPLCGRDVWIIPDCDDAGRGYARDVVRHAYAAGARAVRVLELGSLFPELSFDVGDDIADVVAIVRANPDRTKLAALAERIRRVALSIAPEPRDRGRDMDGTETVDVRADDERVVDAGEQALLWRPFPVDALPAVVARYVHAAAHAIGCDPSYIALPLMTAFGGCIGMARVVRVYGDWVAPPILWTMLIGESGTRKSAALRDIRRILHDIEAPWHEAYIAALREYERSLMLYQRDVDDWKRRRRAELPPERPTPPVARRLVVQDTTTEALAPILAANARGVILWLDELDGWLGRMDRYAATRGGDVAFWIERYYAEPQIVDRCTRAQIRLDGAGVAITGGIQPAVAQRVFTPELLDRGFLARFLVVWPPRDVPGWQPAEVPPAVRDRIRLICQRLVDKLAMDHDGRRARPRVVALDASAEPVYAAFMAEHSRRAVDATGMLAAAYAKLAELPARLGLIIHLVRWAAGEPVDPDGVDAESLERAVQLTLWHMDETARVYDWLMMGAEAGRLAALVDWVRRRGGRVTARDLYRTGPRAYRGRQQAADDALRELVRLGVLRVETETPAPEGGRPTTVYSLVPSPALETKPA